MFSLSHFRHSLSVGFIVPHCPRFCVYISILTPKTINYKLAILDKNNKSLTGIISPNFRKNNRQYFDVFSIEIYLPAVKYINNGYNINILRDYCKSDKEFDSLYLQLLKMSLLDFYSHQVDRTATNITFEKGVYLSLAPLYDYEETFDVSYEEGKEADFFMTGNIFYQEHKKYIYKNCLFRLVFSSEELNTLFDKYPEIYDCFLSILDIDIKKLLSLISHKYDLCIPQYLINSYIDFDERKKEFVRQIK